MVPGNWRIAFLAAAKTLDESELSGPIRTLQRAGACVDVIGADEDEIRVFRHDAAGATERIAIGVARPFDQVSPREYDAVALPASLMREGCLQAGSHVLSLIQSMQAAGKPILWFPGPSYPQPSPDRLQNSQAINIKGLLADSWRNWNVIDAPRLAASLAYYTVLSLAPLLVLTVSIAGIVVEGMTVQSALLSQVRILAGNEGVAIAQAILQNTQRPVAGIIAGALSILVLLVGASGVFLELRDSLNTVWGARPQYGSGLWSLLRARSFAFLVVIATGFVTSVSMLASALLSTATRFLMQFMSAHHYLLQLGDFAISFGCMTLIFGAIYKFIPDIYIRWSDVWIGAVVTAGLFTSGKALVGLYLGYASIGSAYAAAGSLVVFLTWVYYSSQIFLFGAEFTHVYAFRHGSYSKPSRREANRLQV